MARSKPTRSFSMTYAENTTTNNEGTLHPCLIGPRYILHKMENDNTFAGKFTTGKGIADINGEYTTSLSYPSRSVDQVIIDPADTGIKLTDVLLEVASGLTAIGIKEGTTNCIVFSNAVAGNNAFPALSGYDLRMGDILTIDGTDVVITDVQGALTSATATVKDISGNTPDKLSIGGTFKGTEEAIYLIIVKNKVTDAEGTGYVEAEVSVAKGDLTTSALTNVRFPFDTETAIGTQGVTLTFGSDFEYVEDNNVFIVNALPDTIGDFTEVYINDASMTVTADSKIAAYTKNIITDAVSLSANQFSATSNSIALNETLSLTLADKVYAVKEADVHVTYRELITTDSAQLVAGDSEALARFVGEVDPANPLAFMAFCTALSGTSSYYVVSVAGNDYDSYVKAMNVAFKYENVFAPITYSQAADVLAYANQKLDEYNDPTVAQFKKLWIVDTTKKVVNIYDKTSDGVSLLVTIDKNGGVKFLNGDIISAGVSVGDNLVIPRHYNAQSKSYVTREYKINTIKDTDELTIRNSDEEVRTPEVAYVTRSLSNFDYASLVGSKAAAYNSPYINYVWADSPACTGYGQVDPVFLACTLAGMRAASAPHAPLSEVVVPGWTVGNAYGLSDAELDIMNNKGVWIVYQDRYGEVINRHQLTTCQDGTLAEEDSAVSNACNIARSLRSMLSKYRGDANVTQELVDALRVDLVHALTAIANRQYEVKVGKQLIGYEIGNLSIDQDNRARIMLDADLDVPEPLLDGYYHFNII